jgi:hypothetical protein
MTARTDRADALVRSGHITAEQACVHKVAYPTINDARHAAKAVSRQHGRKVETYLCPFADPPHYHITKRRHGEDE